MTVQSLNQDVHWVTPTRSTYHPLFPKEGLLAVGNVGLDYRAQDGQGFIQIPWEDVQHIYVQMFFKGRYIRAIDVLTEDDQHFEFIVKDPKITLKKIRKHLDRRKFSARQGNLATLFKRK